MNDLTKPYSFLAVDLQLCPSYLYWSATTCFYMKQRRTEELTSVQLVQEIPALY
jgi:hypothetical protein